MQVTAFTRQFDRCVARAAVLRDVVERLLRDPVEAERYTGIDRSRQFSGSEDDVDLTLFGDFVAEQTA